MKPTLFSIEWLGEQTFEGYTQGGDWNGWECPFFPFESAERIVAAYKKLGHRASFDQERDAFCFTNEESGEVEKFSAVEVAGRTLYAIGARAWIWESVAKVERRGV